MCSREGTLQIETDTLMGISRGSGEILLRAATDCREYVLV
jgi:hypothetical protein